MRRTLACFLLTFLAPSAHAATVLVTSLGDGAGSCPHASNCTLRAAVAAANANDTVALDPSLALPGTITLLSSELVINKNLTLAGPGADRLRIVAPAARRVLNVTAGTVLLQGLVLSDGQALGTSGTSAGAATGGAGQNGVPGEGGCLRIAAGATVTLDGVGLRNCAASGGAGGNGGSGPTGGTQASDRAGGAGGSGGNALGGAIAVFGSLTLQHSSVFGSAADSGRGGRGGDGGQPAFGSGGPGGNGGDGGDVRGGAIYVASGGALVVHDSSVTDATATAERGGAGGNGGGAGTGGNAGNGGAGGIGGDAHGGVIYTAPGALLVDLEFATLASTTLAAGAGGVGGTGNANGPTGTTGTLQGEILSSSVVPRVRGSVIGGAAALADCNGTVTASGANLASDATCHASMTVGGFSANFGPASIEERGHVVWRPRSNSVAIDTATDCNDLDAAPVTRDVLGTARPQDGNGDGTAACDLGAVEYTVRLFANGFEGP